jgi:hypothetical protein
MTQTHMGMCMGVNSYLPVYIGDPMMLFLCRGYEYEVIIPDRYLSIAISTFTWYKITFAAPWATKSMRILFC